MYYVGIDIGSTGSKVVVFKDDEIIDFYVRPTGWSSVETANEIKTRLLEKGINDENSKIVATGYGRVSVPYADKVVTEITCHGKGAAYLFKDKCTVLDIGGQDTKVITLEDGMVKDFIMNDKCSAGTGRFLEIMANTLGVTLEELSELAKSGQEVTISSMCTVFAESEVISLIGRGTKKEDIAYAVLDSIASKVKSLCTKHGSSNTYYLTGGLCGNSNLISMLEKKLGAKVHSGEHGRYAGAIGAAIVAKGLK
ncbi:acyl-CoA dehydratase activase [Clostridium hydrogeniformans]|uniref:acyl-CoA dehydratase activase n=1 Tax=Clostridium hydrogeniformans TaxID=349933 RepID=UPI000487A7DE|nr:acyl-CoA dehydratase activase [Clostridium hydrogeniformans]